MLEGQVYREGARGTGSWGRGARGSKNWDKSGEVVVGSGGGSKRGGGRAREIVWGEGK